LEELDAAIKKLPKLKKSSAIELLGV